LSEPPGPTCTVSVCTETISAAVPSHTVGRTRAASVEMLAYDCLHCARPCAPPVHLRAGAMAMRAEGWASQRACGCRSEVFSVHVIPSMGCPAASVAVGRRPRMVERLAILESESGAAMLVQVTEKARKGRIQWSGALRALWRGGRHLNPESNRGTRGWELQWKSRYAP
jgi:hypothetical protein